MQGFDVIRPNNLKFTSDRTDTVLDSRWRRALNGIMVQLTVLEDYSINALQMATEICGNVAAAHRLMDSPQVSEL
jgi:hypothetical protein